MGYSYGQGPSGRWILACDSCGAVGGVRKRTCRYKVLGDTLRSPARYALPYCPAPALCTPCFQKHGGSKGLHGESCAEGAAHLQAEADAIETGLDAGESFVVCAWGDWAAGVPEGQVKVDFRGRAGETSLLIPKDAYDSGAKPRLSDYPEGVPA